MPSKSFAGGDQTLAAADDDGTLPPAHGPERPSVGAYAQVAALLHESRREAPDEIGSFLARRVAEFGMRELSVYVTDFEQRRLVPIAGSAATASIGMDDSAGGRSFTRATQVDEVTAGGVRLWSVVVDGAARLGVMSVTMSEVYGDGRALADSLAGVVAALLITRGQCTDAYTALRRSKKFSLAAEMQWDLLPPLSLDSGRVSVAGLIQPAYEVGGDSFDYAVNGDTLDFAVFDAMGHGLVSSQLAHLAVSSYRHSRRSGLDLEATYEAMDGAVAARSRGEEFVTCILGRINLLDGQLTWVNVAHPLPLLVRGGEVLGSLPCEPTLPAGLGSDELGHCVAEVAHAVLVPGDRLFCITDGVVDAHRPGGEDFGRERLVTLLRDRSRAGLDATETVRQLSHTVLDHHGVLSDDTTAFLVDFH
ncbi:MAG TPA: PP2C family protein-serine/threonine phosphatase [Acidimicrobiales bacterium]|nr:PP2C family protein-serine/threonine phosphatase [Acidimicrobiales bacterium]